ncbi:protein phosphatase 1 regulatory subunit 1C isoform 3-T3 [Macrochelys suwanniensis]
MTPLGSPLVRSEAKSFKMSPHALHSCQIDEKRKNNSQGESQNTSPKQRKQSVYAPPAIKGVKHLKSQNDSAVPEEEEGANEREEEWDH